MTQIVEVEFETAEHLLHRVGVAVLESGIGSDSRTYLVEIVVARVLLHDLVYVEFALGTPAYEGHIPHKDVPELRQFVEMVHPEEFADLGQARVVVAGVQCRAGRLCVGAHGTEFIYIERPAETAYPFLLVDCRSLVAQLDGQEAYQYERREDDQKQAGQSAVRNAFCDAPEGAHSVEDHFLIAHVLEGLAGEGAEMGFGYARGVEHVYAGVNAHKTQLVLTCRFCGVVVGKQHTFEAETVAQVGKRGLVTVGINWQIVYDKAGVGLQGTDKTYDIVVRGTAEAGDHCHCLVAGAINHYRYFLHVLGIVPAEAVIGVDDEQTRQEREYEGKHQVQEQEYPEIAGNRHREITESPHQPHYKEKQALA